MLFLPARYKWIDQNISSMKITLVYGWHDLVALLPSNAGSSLDNSVVRWCCISDAELRKCEEWALSIKSDPLVCVQATSMTNCIEMIKVGEILWSEYVIRPHGVCMSLFKLSERKKWLYTRGTSGKEREIMQGNFQTVGKCSCLFTQIAQVLFVLFSVMLLAE